MVFNFNQKTDNLDSKSKVNLSMAARIYLLNEGQLSLIKKRYGGLNTSYRVAFEEVQKRRDEFQRILVTNERLDIKQDSVDKEIYTADITQTKKEYMFLARTNVMAAKGNCGSRRLKGILKQTDDLDIVLDSPLEQSFFEWGEVVFRMTEDKLQFITDSTFSIKNSIVDYLRYPSELSMKGYKDFNGTASTDKHCELPKFMHYDIVDEAAAIYTSSLTNPDLQAKLWKMSNDE